MPDTQKKRKKMIETSDIYRSLRQLVENSFEHKVQIKDLKNPKPPCFYVKYIDCNSRQTGTEFFNDSYVFDVIYFSQKETLQDLIKIEKTLKKIFSKPLKIELTDENGNTTVQYQEIENISTNFNEDDYILNCTLDISLDQQNKEDTENRYGEYDNDELMEDLEI